jgi:predicted NAD/FAD-binding protein
MRRVAVIGSGISGLAAARALSATAQVTLFEADPRCGGHAHTVDVTIGGVTHGVDTGFLVLNARTYPHLLSLFAEIGVELAAAEMSFSVQVRDAALEWSGASLDGVFAQRRNLGRPAFLRMLRDVLRFNRIATAIAEGRDSAGRQAAQTIGDFLQRERFSEAFRDWYFLPMIGSIWSCPTDQMLAFPLATMLRFCRNHGLLQITGRPQWYSVRGGARRYVDKIVAGLSDVRTKTPVRGVRRTRSDGRRTSEVLIATDAGSERYDDVVLACHSDQSLALLDDPTPAERAVLGAIRYQANRAVLHTDASALPSRRRAWAAWNYERAALESREGSGVCLHYLINRLQPLPFDAPVIVSLNPLSEPRHATIHGAFDYAHPIFDARALAAQHRLATLQGVGHTWYCGAWTGYGFHEDGLVSGLSVAAAIAAQDLPQQVRATARPAAAIALAS